MKKIFVAAFLIVMILLSSSVFVHISTDLMVSDAVIMRADHSVCSKDRRAAGYDDFNRRMAECPFLNKRVEK
jgi:hypothetical protein